MLLSIVSISIFNALFQMHLVHGTDNALIVDAFSRKAPFDGRGINQSSEAFSPLEEMLIYALVTYNGDPVASIFISFQVIAPTSTLNQFRVVVTNQSGVARINFSIPWVENVENIAFGEWRVYASVSIAGRLAFDVLTYKVGWLIDTKVRTVTPTQYPEPRVEKQNFVKGNEVGLEITLENIAISLKDITLTIGVYDALNQQIYETIMHFTMPHGELLIYRTFYVPKWAATGTAVIRVAVFDKEPSLGGVIYCPEKSVTFNIVLRDIAIVAASISAAELYVDQTLSISVTVKNFGAISENFSLSVLYDSAIIGTVDVISLEPNAERAISFLWNTSNVDAGVYSISSSASRVPEETNIINNNYVIGQVKVLQRRTPISQRDLYIILWIILLMFLFALLALLVLRRRKKDESEILEQMSYFLEI
jgi:hypothetical protein